MPASSRAQQRLFGAVHSCKKHGKCASPEIEKIASSISDEDAEDFARTKHKGLPEKKKKKKRLKSFREYAEQQNLNLQTKQMAGITMGGDGEQLRNQASQAGINTTRYYHIMSKWLKEIEEKLNLSGQQSGEEANNWHPQAVQILQSLLHQAAGGKRQWMLRQQLKNIKQRTNQPEQPQQMPQQQQPQPQAGGGPTPLDQIGGGGN